MGDAALLCYCRAGFEPELAAELTERAGLAGLAGWARTDRQSGYVVFHGEEREALVDALPFEHLIFARQKVAVIAELAQSPIDAPDPLAATLTARQPDARFDAFLSAWIDDLETLFTTA